MVTGFDFGDITFSFRIDSSLCPKPTQPPVLPLNDLGLPVQDRYRTGDVCKILKISPDLFRWRLEHGYYPTIEPGRDAKGRTFTLDQVRAMLDVPPPRNRGRFGGVSRHSGAVVPISKGSTGRKSA